MCSSVVCVVGSHLEMIPMIQKQLRSMSTSLKQNYYSLQQLLRGLQEPVDDIVVLSDGSCTGGLVDSDILLPMPLQVFHPVVKDGCCISLHCIFIG